MKTKYSLIILFSALYIIFAFSTYKAWPIANGEEFRYLRGKETLNHLVNGEFTELLVQPRPHYFLYNGYTAMLVALNSNFYYEWFHLMNLLFSLSIFVAVYFLGLKLFKDVKWALLSLVSLVLFPTFFGQMAINPVDMPFAALYLLSLLAILHVSSKRKFSAFNILTLGVLFGVSQGLRQLGLTLYILLFLMDLVHEKNIAKLLKRRMGDYLLIFIVANFLMLITWPNFAVNYFKSALWYLSIGQNFYLWDFGLLFGGEILTNPERPAYYLPLLQFITSPVYIIGSLVFVLAYFKRLIKNKTFLLLSYAFGLNYILYFVLNPVLYDGTRHFLYLVPVFTLLGLAGLRVFLNSQAARWLKLTVVLLVALNLTSLAVTTIKTFPNHYVYFNEFSELFGNPYYKFEADYSSVFYKQAAEWVRENYLTSDVPEKLKVYACDNGYAVDYYSHKKFDVVLDTEEANLIICDYRTLKGFKGGREVSGEVIYQVEFEGNPVTYIFKP